VPAEILTSIFQLGVIVNDVSSSDQQDHNENEGSNDDDIALREIMAQRAMQDDEEEDVDEDERVFGFSASEVDDLAAQGIHPWDSDAGGVLAALYGDDDEYGDDEEY
jgi:hypothetical protein